jgi:hypothetical protein
VADERRQRPEIFPLSANRAKIRRERGGAKGINRTVKSWRLFTPAALILTLSRRRGGAFADTF